MAQFFNTDKEVRRSLHVEDVDSEVHKYAAQSSLKLDANGLPLVPQPSDHKDDPLVGDDTCPMQLWLPEADFRCRIGHDGTSIMFCS